MIEEIKLLAYAIYQTRCRLGDPNAGNASENWARAKQCLCPGDMTIEEMQQV
jgi:hypothetical protein